MPDKLASKVLLIGWDAADWKVINPLLDAGKMPTLNRLVNRGVMGNISTLDPPFSPMLWTSIATGKTADEHGVLNFTQPSPDGQSARPILGSSRKVKALWNILNQEGYRSNIVGWWPSHPVDPINGAMVSDFFHRSTNPPDQPWPLPPGAVHPPEFAETLAGLRVHPGELTQNHLLPFVPLGAEVDQEDEKGVLGIAKIIAEASTVHMAATWLMENSEWDFMAVYYDAIDHFGHGYMKYHPPRRSHIDETLYERYKGVVEAGYLFHDMMLDELLRNAGEDTTVILLSDHGFHSDQLRPKGIPKEPAGPAIEHREHGIICMAGPGISKDEPIYGASLLDVTPTVLTLFGLPVGNDMPGKPLLAAFDHPVDFESIPSWELVEGDSAMRDADGETDPWVEQEAMRQLIALGYVDAPGESDADMVASSVRESRYNLARVYLSTRRPREAHPLLQALHEEIPTDIRYAFKLIQCQLALHDIAGARQVIDVLLADRSETMTQPRIDLLHGSILVAEGNIEAALEAYLEAERRAGTRAPAISRALGDAYQRLARNEEALEAFDHALAVDPENAHTHRGRAESLLRLGRNEEAAEASLNAIALRYAYPAAHQILGQALIRLRLYERAAQAFKVTLRLNPASRQGHFWLAEIYRLHLNDPARASYHLKWLEDNPEASGATPLRPIRP